MKNIVDQAKPWLELSDNELWDLMFSHTLERAWMVWSDGHCPTCKKDVVMYNWKINAWYIPGSFNALIVDSFSLKMTFINFTSQAWTNIVSFSIA